MQVQPCALTHIARLRHQQAAVVVHHVAREALPRRQQQRRRHVAEVDEGVAGAARGEGQHLEGGQRGGSRAGWVQV